MKLTLDELREKVTELESHKGRYTELISVYIPAGYDVNSVQRQLEAQKSTEKIVRYLNGLKKTPENGLVLFSGNISKVEGQMDLQLWDIEPPTILRNRLYRCDKDFVLEPLREMLEVSEIFGLLVMDRKEATI